MRLCAREADQTNLSLSGKVHVKNLHSWSYEIGHFKDTNVTAEKESLKPST